MQFEETDGVGPHYKRWADLSWKLSVMSLSDGCKAVLQEGTDRILIAYFRRQLYIDLIGVWYDVVDDDEATFPGMQLTPAQGIAKAACFIEACHDGFHWQINNTDFEPEVPYWASLSIYY